MKNNTNFWKGYATLVVLFVSANWTMAQNYCTPSFYNEFNDKINKVKTTGALINFENDTQYFGAPDGYSDFTATHSVTVVAGETFTIDVDYGSCFAGIGIWIDENNNKVFDTNEQKANTSNQISPQSITVTVTNNVGTYRMRVMAKCFAQFVSPTPCMNSSDGEAEDYTVIVVNQNPCSGTPTAGMITVTPTSENAGNNYVVSASGHSVIDFNYSYQWQSKTNGADWINEGSATSTYADLNKTANPIFNTIVEYRLIVTCTNSNLSNTSNVATFRTHREYCYPKQSPSSVNPGLNNVNSWITSFSTSGGVVDISNLNSGRENSNGYFDYSGAHQAVFNPNTTVNFDLACGTSYQGASGWNMGIWVDWNNDGNLTSNEQVYISPNTLPTTIGSSWATSGSFTIPSSTADGIYRMRVVHKLNSSPANDPCFMNHGDIEDYSLIVTASSCIPPVVLTSTQNTVTNTTLSWTPTLSGNRFEVEWGTEWFTLGTGTKINGLQSNSVDVNTTENVVYQFYVRTDCGNNTYSIWNGPFKFSTGYCIPKYMGFTNCNIEMINFEFGNLAHTSVPPPFPCDGNIYHNHTNMYVEASEGETISYLLESYNNFTHAKIWVDWDKNGTFDPSEELLYRYVHVTGGNNPATGTITLPSNIPLGDYRLRLRFSSGQITPSQLQSCNDLGSRTKDYTLRILGPPCVINIPDANFKNALLTHSPAVDTNGDGQIQCSEAIAFAGTLNVNGSSISDLTGIEAFVNIFGLQCNFNNLSSIDLTHNTKLQELDVTQNNALTMLDISHLSNLTHLRANQNNITHLDVSNNTKLVDIRHNNSKVVSLDLSNNPRLENVIVRAQDLLKSVNIQNGNNTIIPNVDFRIGNDSLLTCIQVDDVAYSNANWTKDTWATFTQTTCANFCADISELNLTATTGTTVAISWSGTAGLYDIEWGNVGFVPGTSSTQSIGTETSNVTNYTVNQGLTAGNSYDIYVRSNCGSENVGNWIPIRVHTGYCTSVHLSSFDYISAFVTSGGLSNLDFNSSSQQGSNGYADLTATQIISLQAGSSFVWSADYVDANGIGVIKIWVDYNNDFSFDSTELIYSGTGSSQSQTYTIPISTTLGSYRMRVRTTYSNTNMTACSTEYWGQTLDFTLTVLDPTCPNVSGIATSNLNTTSTNITWTAGGGYNEMGWNFGYAKTSDEYNPNTNTGTPIAIFSGLANSPSQSLSGLTPNTSYDIYIQSDCSVNQSNWEKYTFITLDLCPDISGINHSNMTTNSVAISWTAGGGSAEVGWNLGYAKISDAYNPNTNTGTPIGTFSGLVANPNQLLSGLDPNTSYDLYVQSNCGANQSNWEKYTFTTLALCPDITSIVSETVTHNSISISWTAGGGINEMGWNVQYGTQGFTLGEGTTLPPITGTPSATINTGLSPNTTYDIYVQSDCSVNQSDWVKIEVTTDHPPCLDISNFVLVNATTSQVVISWTAGGSESQWNTEWDSLGYLQGTTTNTLTVGSPTITITGLQANSSFDLYVQADCGANQSSWVKFTFSTLDVCSNVSGVTTSNATATTIDVSWTSVGTESAWNIRYVEQGQPLSSAMIVPASTNPFILTGLSPNTTYQVWVQADCSVNQSGWGTSSILTTLLADDVISRSDFTQNTIKLFPNPTSDFITISSQETIKSVSVYNLIGQQILQNAEITNKQLDLRLLSSGTYLLKITLENGDLTRKLIKN